MFHWNRLRTMTMTIGISRNSTRPIRLGARKANAVRTVRRRSAAFDTAAALGRFGRAVVGAVATLIAPPMTGVTCRPVCGSALRSGTLGGRFHQHGNATLPAVSRHDSRTMSADGLLLLTVRMVNGW